MNEIQLHRIDLNLLVTFEALMEESTLTAAADRLAITPSAVSHALGRLRTQLNDPLLVRVGGRMKPSPYALELIEEVRPVLRGLRRMLAPRHPFDLATSDRRGAPRSAWPPPHARAARFFRSSHQRSSVPGDDAVVFGGGDGDPRAGQGRGPGRHA